MRRAFNYQQKQEIWRRDRGICGICGRKVRGDWHADHIVPWAFGGETSVDNGQVAHPGCNQRKGTDSEHDEMGWNRNWRSW